MKHSYDVNPIEHQPQWPVNDNEPLTLYPMTNHLIAALLFTASAVTVIAGLWFSLSLAGIL